MGCVIRPLYGQDELENTNRIAPQFVAEEKRVLYAEFRGQYLSFSVPEVGG